MSDGAVRRDDVTPADEVLAILDAIERAGVSASIGGGWGVDALVGAQTRVHADLDLCVPSGEAGHAIRALEALGYRVTLDQRPTRLVLAAPGRGSVDLHPLRLLPDGSARLAGFEGVDYVLPAGCLDGTGSIGGRSVRCFTLDRQLVAHGGYEPAEHDLWDLARLHELSRVE